MTVLIVCVRCVCGGEGSSDTQPGPTNRQLCLCCSLQKPLGEQFRKEVHIKNLPTLFKKPKPMLETEVLDSDAGGLATIFEP